jgi:hypothetical protein
MPRGCSAAPRLPVGHTFEPATVRQWQSWHSDGYADRWSETQRASALELLGLIDDLARLPADGEPSLRLRLTRFIAEQRSALGLLAESPRAVRERAERARAEREADYEARSQGRPSADEAREQRAAAVRADEEARAARHRAAHGEAA